MDVSEDIKSELDCHFKWKHGNVQELDVPVLVLFSYAPSGQKRTLSIAFDCSGGAKCWLSETQLKKIGEKCPSHHPDYKTFILEDQVFHPFSVQPFPTTIFRNFNDLMRACHSLYDHIELD